MKKLFLSTLALLCWAMAWAQGPQVKVEGGMIEGIDSSGVKIFRGIPFAAPPINNLRWKAPQPVVAWKGVRSAKEFGANPLQKNVFGDMVFGSKAFSEDCLYLNVWTPTRTYREKLPVLIYFNGGGFVAGSGSEPRYQGLTLARKGIIVVTANYRESVFGFLSTKALSKENSKENGYQGSGNQGLMDQAAAIKWVYNNIEAFGGDPKRITIDGESAGSASVSAQMVSPMSRGYFSQVMASSGSLMGTRHVASLQEAELFGDAFMKKAGCKNLEELRRMPAEKLLDLYQTVGLQMACIDGKFLVEQPIATYEKNQQAQVPALIGFNNCELPVIFMLGKAPTLENLKPYVQSFFNTNPDDVLALYNIHSDADIVNRPGYELGGDIFIAYSTWKWLDLLAKNNPQPVYRYLYCHARPEMTVQDKQPGLAGGTTEKKANEPAMPAVPGAVHSADIEYAMGNLATNPMFKWNADDYQVSEIFQQIYLNFVKTGNPNGLGLPQWDAINGKEVAPVMYIDLHTRQVVSPKIEARYRTIDRWLMNK